MSYSIRRSCSVEPYAYARLAPGKSLGLAASVGCWLMVLVTCVAASGEDAPPAASPETASPEAVSPESVVPAAAANEAPAANLRWSEQGRGGTPEFARHIAPLLGKAGCNNRACHGSFQGQNGFRLSLFGHDLKLDHDELTLDEGDGPRIDVENPDRSSALRKPTELEDHDGGKRFDVDSWQYRMFRAWIAAGGPWNAATDSAVRRIAVEPSEVVLRLGSESGRRARLRVRAWFSDGTWEDVTALTSFATNDDAVVRVGEDGELEASGPGDTAVVVTFGGEVTATQIFVPHQRADSDFDYESQVPLDRFVAEKLHKLRLRPSEIADDEVFVRRVYLDAVGTLPTPDEVRAFLSDRDPQKRSKWIDRLLDRPEYAMYWAMKFSDWTGNNTAGIPAPADKTSWMWQDWIRRRLEQNVPYDEIMAGILLATTREGRSLDECLQEFTARKKILADGFDRRLYPARKTLDLYFNQRDAGDPEVMALQTAYTFLGTRLECAQCHKHPFDRWTQDDFRGFASFFKTVRRAIPADVPMEFRPPKFNPKGELLYREVVLQDEPAMRAIFAERPPKLLGGEELKYEPGVDPRAALVAWMRSPDNPFFAPAMVNRIWAHYFGRGIVEPPDDFNAGNPPSNPQLLEHLVRDFIASGFDLKRVHRTILNSRTYQLSWVPNETNLLDERNFSRASLRRMPAEVLVDALNDVTGHTENYAPQNAPLGTRAIEFALTHERGVAPWYELKVFGRPSRTQFCDCEREKSSSLSQAMYLINDANLATKIQAPQGRLAKLLGECDDERLIEELYLTVLSRFPSDDEREIHRRFIADAASRETAFQDVLWTLVNHREFIFLH